MLPAGNRLRRRREFATAVRRGRRAGRPSVVVHFHLEAGHDSGRMSEGGDGGLDHDGLAVRRAAEPPKVGFVVARSVGGAVTRNAVRRRLRHLVQERLDRLPPRAVVVVRATPAAADASYAQLAADVDSALDRLMARSGSTR